MILFSDLPEITRTDEPMSRHTSFRVGGPVRYFLEPRDPDELQLIHRRCLDAGLRVRTLGRGCNTLVTDGPHYWAVISTRRLRWFRRQRHRIDVGAGFDLASLVARTEREGLGGFEALAGIPGTIGGAVAMNAGGRYGSIGDCLVGALVALPAQPPRQVPAAELGLGYRASNVRDGRPLLLSATFELERAPLRELRERRRAILAEKHAAQPVEAWSAGCVFKNPPGDSAGRLIDTAGLKGTRVGGALVSPKHANFIVNCGNATATDILQLITLVVQRVHDAHGVCLGLEIEVWDDPPSRGNEAPASAGEVGDKERSGYGRA